MSRRGSKAGKNKRRREIWADGGRETVNVCWTVMPRKALIKRTRRILPIHSPNLCLHVLRTLITQWRRWSSLIHYVFHSVPDLLPKETSSPCPVVLMVTPISAVCPVIDVQRIERLPSAVLIGGCFMFKLIAPLCRWNHPTIYHWGCFKPPFLWSWGKKEKLLDYAQKRHNLRKKIFSPSTIQSTTKQYGNKLLYPVY